MNSTKTLQWSPLQLIVDSTAAIGGVHCSVQWNPRQCFVESTARSECLRYLIVESNALQRNSLQKNRQKCGIDCNVIAFVKGLRCTLPKAAVQRNPLQIFKIPTFGTVMKLHAVVNKTPAKHREVLLDHELKATGKCKKNLKSFLVTIQYLSKFLSKL